MAQDWMIDVLADLRQYAIRHYYVGLAEQLDDAIVIAATELRQRESFHDSPADRHLTLVDSSAMGR